MPQGGGRCRAVIKTLSRYDGGVYQPQGKREATGKKKWERNSQGSTWERRLQKRNLLSCKTSLQFSKEKVVTKRWRKYSKKGEKS